MNALLGLLCIIPLVSCIPFTPVPVFYVTETDITSEAKETFLFGVKTCGGEQFEHNTATVFINFPDKEWQPFLGDFVYASVIDSHGHILATNGDKSGNFLNAFKFFYHSSNGDLTLNITAGNAPVFKYTITVTFSNASTTTLSETTISPQRFVQTRQEVEAWKRITEMLPQSQVQDLVTVFKTTGSEIVPTAGVIGLELQYCFSPDKFPGNVSISVLATDEVSGFATYVCTKDVACKSTEDAKFFDVSGASVNFVNVLITATTAGSLRVIVRGDGRYQGKNTFNLAASKYTHHPALQWRYKGRQVMRL